MAFIFNPSKKFRESARLTSQPIKGKYPSNAREAFCIAKTNEDGIFQIESNKELCVFDRCYLFTDLNYVNADRQGQKSILKGLMSCLNYMNSDYKITVANEYLNLQEFLDEIFLAKHKDDYPTIDSGMRQWMKELVNRAELKNLEKVLYLTITVRAKSYDEAKSYFFGMDLNLQRLFREMNSILIPLNGKQRLRSIQKFIYFDEEKTEISFDNAYDDPMLSVIPVDIQASEKNFMVFDGNRYVSVLFAKSIGNSINSEEVIHTLTNVSYPSYLTIDVAPVDKDILKSKLNNAHMNIDKSIADENDEKVKNHRLLMGISYQKSKKKEELEDYMDQVDDHDEESVLGSMLIIVSAMSEEDLADRVDDMIRKAKDKHVTLDTYNWVQLKAFNTALPIGARLVEYMRSFFVSSLVAFQPFYAQDVMETGGALLGVNQTTNHFVIGNRKMLRSPHGIIIGPTGTGKSFFVKLTEIVQSLLFTDDDVICIDPQNELEAVSATFHGTYLDFSPQSQIYVNAMEVPVAVFKGSQKDKNQFVAAVKGWANSFCEAAMRGIVYTSDHQSAVSKCVRGIYEEFFASPVMPAQPTLKTLRERLAALEQETDNEFDRQGIHQLFNALDEYTEGAYDMFAYDTNVDMSNRFIAFGLANVEEAYWEPVMITLMFFLSTRMEYNKSLQRATRFFIDETQVVTQNKASATMLLNAALTFRKFGGLCTFALQNLTHALELPELRDMFQNCGYKVFFDQGGVDKIKLAQIQEFSKKEYEELSSAGHGKCVMVWNKQVISLDARMDSNNPLYDVFNTDFHEKAQNQLLQQVE